VIPPGVRIFVCLEPVDMRLGFDRLARIARERLGCDPVDGGALFVFGARGSTRLKVLWFDRNGLCVLYKRFHQAKFELPKAGGGQGVLAHRCGCARGVARRCAASGGVVEEMAKPHA
jgi:transposase